jgi:hypothetical protein
MVFFTMVYRLFEPILRVTFETYVFDYKRATDFNFFTRLFYKKFRQSKSIPNISFTDNPDRLRESLGRSSFRMSRIFVIYP